nr:hypothetical protein [Burkholderia lata]
MAALPRWLADEYADRMPVVPVKLGKKGIAKQIFLDIRDADATIDYLAAFVALARESTWSAPRMLRQARPVAMRVRRRACQCVRRARPMRRTAGRSSST